MAVYSDINQFHEIEADKIYDIQDIYQSITNVLFTPRYSRLFRPNFGYHPDNNLFDLNDQITATEIRNQIYFALEANEPRVRMNFKATRITPIKNSRTLEIFLVFNIVGIENQQFQYTGLIYKD